MVSTRSSKEVRFFIPFESSRTRKKHTAAPSCSNSVNSIVLGNSVVSSESLKMALLPIAPFSKKDPASWFRQLEATFVINNVNDDETKYIHLQARLDPDILSEISEFFKTPPAAGDRYEKLKDKLVKRFSDSRDNQVLQLLEGLTLGDRRPSELLSEIQKLAADDLAENVVRALFIKKLPGTIKGILAGSNEPLSSLGALADRIYDFTNTAAVGGINQQSIAAVNVSQPSIAAIKPVDPNTQLLNLLVENVSKLTMRITDLENQSSRGERLSRYQERSPTRNRSQSPYRPRSESRQRFGVPSGVDLCFYHYKFGKEAKKCKQLDDGRDCLMKSLN